MRPMGRYGVVVVVAMVVVVVSVSMSGADGAVSCLSVNGGGAPFADAAAVVQKLRGRSGQCCHRGSGFCTVVATSGNAAATVCATSSTCPTCKNVGEKLNLVLARCNRNNKVQGAYSPDGTSQKLFYLTSKSTHP